MKRRLYRAIALLAILPVLLIGGRYGLFLLRPVMPEKTVSIVVRPGTPFGRVAEELQDAGVISSTAQFKVLARLRGDAQKVHVGKYLFAQPATPNQVLDRLVTGDTIRLQLTVPEGFSLIEIARKLQELDFPDGASFLPLTSDKTFMRSMGIEAPSLEGYLFPDTYIFGIQTSSRQLIRTMVDHFEERMQAELLQKAKTLGLDRHGLVTLASIIQKEAGNNQEMPLISAVFHNRLQSGMRLQADPTVIYGLEVFDGNLTRRHLRETTPYNTYRMSGLPPGPITNPGIEALIAAANPAKVDYLYFVGRGDGTHQFSTTLQEHNAAVRRYQLKR